MVLKMSRNRPLTEAELQYIVDHLSDEEYCLSEFDGDEDADDNFPETSSISRTPSHSTTTSIDSHPTCSSTSVQHLKRVRQCTLTRKTNNSSGKKILVIRIKILTLVQMTDLVLSTTSWLGYFLKTFFLMKTTRMNNC
uniref:Uncharacterized protein LOC114338256 isoform X1 n=2 Tax=Diabrotica virgifera virgifera TaxID=50390 RepID=A0A6P7GLJ7_DIAVI